MSFETIFWIWMYTCTLLSSYILHKNSYVYFLLMSAYTVQVGHFEVDVDSKDMFIHVYNVVQCLHHNVT